jgi:hypothetical protein
MWVIYWERLYLLGMVAEDELRPSFELQLFAGRPGREYWEYMRDSRYSQVRSRRARRFYQILNESYQEAIARQPMPVPPVVVNPMPQTPYHGKTNTAKAIGGLALAVVVGVLADRIVGAAFRSRR